MPGLTPLQDKVLRQFFDRVSGFVLSGGAALVGFHLYHRETLDLDLLTRERRRLHQGELALRSIAEQEDLAVERIETSPSFLRFLLRGKDEAIVVDLVHDATPRAAEPTETPSGVIVDSPGEIMAAKLCALLSRGETRDLVDVMLLERAGFAVERFLEAATAKDASLTPGQLAWVLSHVEIPRQSIMPGEVSAGELKEWLASLVDRLTALASPGG